eukprot:4676111-Pleurochrysis_carterae.AAC.3
MRGGLAGSHIRTHPSQSPPYPQSNPFPPRAALSYRLCFSRRHQLTFATVHALHENRFAHRDFMSDIIVTALDDERARGPESHAHVLVTATHARMHTHTHTHARTHARAYARTHARTRTHVRKRTHA